MWKETKNYDANVLKKTFIFDECVDRGGGVGYTTLKAVLPFFCDFSEENHSWRLLYRTGINKVHSSRQFARLADTYREKGELDKAISILEKGLEDNPDYVTARIILAACFIDQGRLQKALEEYERVLELDPFHTAAMKKIARLLLDMDKPAEAKRFLVSYLEEVPDDEDVKRSLSSIDDRISFVEAESEEEAKTVVGGRGVSENKEKSPTEDESAEAGRSVRPGAEVVDDLEHHPDEIEHEAIPVQEVESQEAETVKEEESVKKEPTGGEEEELIATMTLAEIYASQGFIEKAIQIYQKILTKEPSNETARKRIEAIRGEGSGTTSGEVPDERTKDVAEKVTSGGPWRGDGAPGAVVEDEEYEHFKRWLKNLIRKKDKKENQG